MTNKYRTYAITDRPKTFDEVVGHKAVKKAIKTMLDHEPETVEEKAVLGLLLYSDAAYPGVGKTTLAYCIPHYLREKGHEVVVVHVDCADQSKTADVKATLSEVNAPRQSLFSEKPVKKILLLEEIHLINNVAASLFLKPAEEARNDFMIVGTTTNIEKFNAAFRSRFKEHQIKPLKTAEMREVLRRSLPDVLGTEEIENALIRRAAGSPRRMLAEAQNLMAVGDIELMHELLDDSAVTRDLQLVINKIVYPYGDSRKYEEIHKFITDAKTAGNLNIDTFFWQLKATLNKAVRGVDADLKDFSAKIRKGDQSTVARASILYELLEKSAYSDDSPVDKEAKMWNLIMWLKNNKLL
jgi:replication-associated recombination protein RarA